MSNFATEPEWDKAVAAVAASTSVLLLAHVTPDADALGSALGLGLALKSLGKQVQVSVGEENFSVPSSLNFLPGIELINSPEELQPADLVISCDVSSDARLGTTLELLQAAPMSIAIDHHPSFTGFGKIHLVDPAAAATAELALEFIDRLNVKVTPEIATVIYAGLATDTGSFKFQSTTAQTLRTAARLVESGNTVLVIEHNLDVIKTADWIIDMGPEGGDGGGRIIAEGTPEVVAKVKGSYTGKFLGPLLKKKP